MPALLNARTLTLWAAIISVHHCRVKKNRVFVIVFGESPSLYWLVVVTQCWQWDSKCQWTAKINVRVREEWVTCESDLIPEQKFLSDTTA